MNTIFRKVSVRERLPEKDFGAYVFLIFSSPTHVIIMDDDSPSVIQNLKTKYTYWLEAVELPTDEELEKVMPTTGDFPIETKIDNGFRQQGAILMRGRMLAVTPKGID